jgi:hypothetical protein
MTTKKPEFVDYILKRWPIIMLGAGIAYWILTAIYDMKSEVHALAIMTSRDKEAIYVQIDETKALATKADNKANENEKAIIKIQAILPDRIQLKDK